MRIFNPSALPIGLAPGNPNQQATQGFVLTQSGDLTDFVVAAGNAGSPAPNRTLNIPQHGIVIAHLKYDPGITDTLPPQLEILIGASIIARLGFVAGEGKIAVDAENPGAAILTLQVNQAGIVTGGLSYTAYSLIGGISG